MTASNQAPARFRALVTSSPDMRRRDPVDRALTALRRKHPGLVVVHLDASEGDRIADSWARMMGVEVDVQAPADDLEPRDLPAFINGVLDLGVDGVVALGGGDDMVVFIARQRGVAVWEVGG